MMRAARGPRRAAGLSVAGLVVVTLVAACGSSGSAKATGGSSSTAVPTGSVIKIGVIGSNTGSQASSSSMGSVVASAWGEYVNKELGGINGHPVQIVVVDDKGDPVAAQVGGKQLIDEGVQAVVPFSDNLLTAYDDAFIAAKIPVVSGPINVKDWFSKPGMFPVVTDQSTGPQMFPIAAKQFAHATKYADIYCSEVAACAAGVAVQKGRADKIGLPFTQLAVSGSAASYTAQCLSLRDQKVDDVGLAVASSVAAKFVEDCQAQGYNPTWGISQATIGTAVLALKGVTIIGGAHALPESADTAPAKTFRDAMTKYAKSDNWHHGSSVSTWSGLEVIRKALAGINASTPVTSATIMNGLYTIKNDDLDGLLSNKITFTQGQNVVLGSHNCMFIMQIKDGKESTLNNSKPTCLTD